MSLFTAAPNTSKNVKNSFGSPESFAISNLGNLTPFVVDIEFSMVRVSGCSDSNSFFFLSKISQFLWLLLLSYYENSSAAWILLFINYSSSNPSIFYYLTNL